MYQAQHEDRTIKLLGKPFSEVHAFLDQFFRSYGGLPHRLILHHRLGVELVGVLMGPKALLVAKQHVLDDMLSLPAGPEEKMRLPAYMPSRYDAERISEDMMSMLGYVPDFGASWLAKKSFHLKCGCGYPGPMLRFRQCLPDGDMGPWQYSCAWCKSPVVYGKRGKHPCWPESPSRFDVLRELAVGHRFRKAELPTDLRKLFMATGE